MQGVFLNSSQNGAQREVARRCTLGSVLTGVLIFTLLSLVRIHAILWFQRNEVYFYVLSIMVAGVLVVVAILGQRQYKARAIAQAARQMQTEGAIRLREMQARSTSEHLRKLLDFSLDAVCTFDAEGRFLHANAGCETNLGYTPEELLGTVNLLYVLPEDRETTIEAIKSVMGGQPTIHFENRVLRKDGSVAHMMWSAQWSQADGKIFAIGRNMTAIRLAEAEARKVAVRLEATLENIADAFFTLDREWRFTYMNQETERTLQRTRADLLGKVIWEELPGLKDSAFGQGYRRAMAENRKVSIEDHYAPFDAWFEVDAYPSVEGLAVYFRDVTEKRQSQEQLKLLEASVARLNDSVMIITAKSQDDPGQRIVFVNEAFERLTGYSRKEALGKTPRMLEGPGTQQAELERIREAMDRFEHVRAELIEYTKSGQEVWVEIDRSPIMDAAGRCTHWVGVARDITQRKIAEQEIQYLAFYDPVTRLPNRKLLMDRLKQAFTRAGRTGRWGAAVFIELDHFKLVNDSHGHAAGDEFLQKISQRIVEELRASDTVACYGGDEFVVLLENLADTLEAATAAALHVAYKIRTRLAEGASLEEGMITASASQGIALFPASDQADAQEVLRQANIALYRSKELGRDQICMFEASMASAISEQLDLDQALRNALERKEFSLYLQAKTDAAGQIAGAEVLLRWKHPERGMVSPAIFIPLAEESGAILAIGEWVLREGCKLLSETAFRNPDYSLSINVSPRQLCQSGFAEKVKSILDETGAPPARLTLEVTEGQFVSNMESVVSTMKELRSLGVRISIDDFGTGYSCLFYLQKLPLDELKIDKSFVQSAPNDPSHGVLIDTILSIASQLGLTVVAEGVETEAQLNFLEERGCPLFQGYYFGRPMLASKFLATLDDEAPLRDAVTT